MSYPTIRTRLAILGIVPSRTLAQQLLLFVCGGNTCRSPMAAALAQAQIAGDGTIPRWQVASAGVSDPTAGAPISPDAVTALAELGVEPPADHHARALTPEMCANTKAVYCMTRDQRDKVIAMAPDAAPRTFCLDPEADVPDPVGQPLDAYRNCASHLQKLVQARLAEHREGYALSGAEAG
jgi:protein-tyrosine-phosphatase